MKLVTTTMLMLCALLAVPHLACAYNYWSVTASTSPSLSGALQPPTGPDYVTTGSTTNIVTSTVTTADFTVVPPTGYRLNYVTIDGVSATPVSPNVYRVSKGSKLTHTITAYFATQTYTITTSKTGNGSIDASTTVASGGSKSINIVAGSGYLISSVSSTGAVMTAGDGVTTATYTFTNVQSNQSISVVFAPVPTLTARISTSPQTVVVGTSLLIDATTSSYYTTPTAAWSVTPAGASVVPSGNGLTANFTASAAGSYTVSVTLSAPGTSDSSASVVISAITQAVADSNTCMSCHTNRNPAFVSEYLGSKHATTSTVSCVRCHNSTGELQHPYNKAPGDVCYGCHLDGTGNVPLHPIQIGTNPCVSCHNPHNLVSLVGAPAGHYNNITSAGYPASYMSHRENCLDCHTGTADNAIIRPQWGRSGHAVTTAPAFASLDFKYRDGCVVCHTTTGFLNFTTGKITRAWGQPADYTKELVTCIACHSNRLQGIIRNVVQIPPYPNDSFVNHNLNKSNVCTVCHIGTNNGKSIQVKVGVADFSNTPFVAPHFFTSGGTLQGVSAYQFPGRSYTSYSTNSHRSIGIGNNASTGDSGPCATCHMSHVDKHTFKAISSAGNGQVGAIVSEICVNCHSSSMNAPVLDSARTQFLNSLAVLRAMLAAKGYPYSANAPYFSNTNWGIGQEGANVMGAAYNYALLIREKGAYTHNSQYARQVVLDSIDYLDNGYLDDSLAGIAIPQLLASGAITQEMADSVIAYKTKPNACATCHGFTQASGTPNTTKAHPAHLSSPYGPGSYLGPDVNACQACHAFTPTSHNNGTVNLASGACLACHAGVAPTWSAGRLSCTGCHGASPAVLPNGVAAPAKTSFSSTGHGQYDASNACTTCHDQNAPHISGTLGYYTRLLLPNDNNLCASCHNSTVVRPAFRNMSTHVTLSGAELNCRDCHDPHGTGNLSMIRSQIGGTGIVFTDRTYGLVNTTTNLGLCQVCHTLTAHYRAGIPETGHYSSGCLDCHRHNAAGGAFRPTGGSCDACHGYPPAPKGQTAFGTTGLWANARFEDYSGGGGGHLMPQHISPFAVASEGWTNCTLCHNGGRNGASGNHKMTTPVKSHVENVTVDVDPRYRFGKRFTVYTSSFRVSAPAPNATGSCFNIACHMKPSRRWSLQR